MENIMILHKNEFGAVLPWKLPALLHWKNLKISIREWNWSQTVVKLSDAPGCSVANPSTQSKSNYRWWIFIKLRGPATAHNIWQFANLPQHTIYDSSDAETIKIQKEEATDQGLKEAWSWNPRTKTKDTTTPRFLRLVASDAKRCKVCKRCSKCHEQHRKLWCFHRIWRHSVNFFHSMRFQLRFHVIITIISKSWKGW